MRTPTKSVEFQTGHKITKTRSELKFRLTNPDILGQITTGSEPVLIQQLYLPQADESYSLRLRKTVTRHGQVSYESCLKSQGHLADSGLVRTERRMEIPYETFSFYESQGFPQVHKVRYEPLPGVVVDVIDGLDEPQIEIEDIFLNHEAFEFYTSIKDVLRDVTDYAEGNNQAIAYAMRYRQNKKRPSTIASS